MTHCAPRSTAAPQIRRMKANLNQRSTNFLYFRSALALCGAALLAPESAQAQAAAAQARGLTKPSPLAPSEIVAAAPASDWVAIQPSDLLVMDLPPLAGKARRVVIQLIPAPFSQGWVGNIRNLAAAHWWDGMAVTRVQDNYVAQWGDPNGETPKAKPLPPGLMTVPESGYVVDQVDIQLAMAGEQRTAESEARWRKAMGTKAKVSPPNPELNPDVVSTRTKLAPRGWHQRDSYAAFTQFHMGWPLGAQGEASNAQFWPVHCYGMVGVGRNLSPDTGSGAELYTVIGHAPRHLDRNIALVGR